MAIKNTTASLTNGSAMALRFDGDTNGPRQSQDTTQELELMWWEVDARSAKTLIDALNVQDVSSETIRSDGDGTDTGTATSWGTGWYVAGRPQWVQGEDRSGRIRVVLTKTAQAGQDYRYEDRSVVKHPDPTDALAVSTLTDATDVGYISRRNSKFIARQQSYTNATSPPVFSSTTVQGSLRYEKTQNGRYSGTRTEIEFLDGQSTATTGFQEEEHEPFKMWVGPIRTAEGRFVKNVVYRWDKKVTSSISDAVNYAEESDGNKYAKIAGSDATNPGPSLGWIIKSARYGVYEANKVRFDEDVSIAESATPFTSATFSYTT